MLMITDRPDDQLVHAVRPNRLDQCTPLEAGIFWSDCIQLEDLKMLHALL